MRWILCLLMLAALGFAPAPVYKPTPSEKDLDLLQGKWTFVSLREDDRPANREEGRFIVVRGRVPRHSPGSSGDALPSTVSSHVRRIGEERADAQHSMS